MRLSKIDGKGMLPHSCPHGEGYNLCRDAKICLPCAENRVEELEKIISILGDALRRSVRATITSDQQREALETARNYFDGRASSADLGDWLRD